MLRSFNRHASAIVASSTFAAATATTPSFLTSFKHRSDRPISEEGSTVQHFRDTSSPHPLQSTMHVKRDQAQQQALANNHLPCEKVIDAFGKVVEYHPQVHNEVWSEAECQAIKETYRPRRNLTDLTAYVAVNAVRLGFDVISGYKFGKLTKAKILRRVLFLECAAAVPGFVAAALRHLKSLRNMTRDKGWIQCLLEEAANERMHMLCFLKLYGQPGMLMRACVLITQGILWNTFFVLYIATGGKWCHRFVGHLEESAVHTYTDIIKHMESTDPENAELHAWGKEPAPQIAIHYWKLNEQATILDLMHQVRCDEANHRETNHCLADIKADAFNPFIDHAEAHRRICNDGSHFDVINTSSTPSQQQQQEGFNQAAREELNKMTFGLPVKEVQQLDKVIAEMNKEREEQRKKVLDKSALFTSSVSSSSVNV